HYCERYIIEGSALGLFHGMDCYQAYADYCSNPHLTHDIHLGPEALITPAALAARFEHSSNGTLRIVYAGRVHRDKGVNDWIKVLSTLAKRGVEFHATWFGSGPELLEARRRVENAGLGSRVEFLGRTVDHAWLICELKRFDVFLFCHLTLESPR